MTPEELKEIEERHSFLLKGGPIDMGMVIELARGIGDIGKLLSYIKELQYEIEMLSASPDETSSHCGTFLEERKGPR